MESLLGIDLGTSAVKVMVVSFNGMVLGEASEELGINVPKNGWAEQDPDIWWHTIVKAVKSALLDPRIDPQAIQAIGLSGQMLGLVPLGKDQKSLRPCLLWCDQRSHLEVGQILERIDERDLLDLTCAIPNANSIISKLLWMRNNEVELYNQINHFVMPKDFIVFQLTGSLGTDMTDASVSGLFDIKRRTWASTILNRLELNEDYCPKVYESVEVVGTLLPEIAQEWGLSSNVQVVAGAGDQCAGAVGEGIVKEGVISIAIGTSGVVFGCTEEPKLDYDNHGINILCHSVPGKWGILGCSLSAGASLKWILEKLFPWIKEEAIRFSSDPYDILTSVAAKTSPGSKGLLYLPYLVGERSPDTNPKARGVFFGLNINHSYPEMIRAVLEGVTYNLRTIGDVFQKYGIGIKQLIMSGGGAKSLLWRQIVADVFGVDVITTSVKESPAYGAAILAGVGINAFKDFEDACNNMVHPISVLHNQTHNKEIYQETLQRFQELYSDLEEAFQRQVF